MTAIRKAGAAGQAAACAAVVIALPGCSAASVVNPKRRGRLPKGVEPLTEARAARSFWARLDVARQQIERIDARLDELVSETRELNRQRKALDLRDAAVEAIYNELAAQRKQIRGEINHMVHLAAVSGK